MEQPICSKAEIPRERMIDGIQEKLDIQDKKLIYLGNIVHSIENELFGSEHETKEDSDEPRHNGFYDAAVKKIDRSNYKIDAIIETVDNILSN